MQHKEKYTLKWHSYSDHLKEAFGDMMTSSEFADVTLVTDDKQQIRAHRNILSACSPVFKNILQLDSKNANPVIYLRGIQHLEMKSIMQFIYLGEARFHEERMNEFLMVSKNLEIKELSTGIELNDQAALNEESNENNVDDDVDEDFAQTLNEDGENFEHQTHTTSTKPITRTNKSVKRTGGSKYPCNKCDYQATHQSNLTRHIQSKHEGVKYACNQCDQQFTQQCALTTHIQSIHEGVKYACNQCDYRATQQTHLAKHIKSVHEGVKYPCKQCNQQFTAQSTVTRHIQSAHEGVKYACNQCDYQATQQGNLTSHIESQHKSIKYACSQCDYQGSKDGLRFHVKKHY